MQGSSFALLAVLGSLALATACSGPATSTPANTTPATVATPAPIPTALLPRPSTALAPAQTELSGSLTGDTVTETESCAGCHADAAAQWRYSAHAFGSFNNPIYRVVVDRFRADVGKDASRFCAGC